MNELSFIFNNHLTKSELFLKVFKDNQSFISVAESNKVSPRTKHITIKYHHFWSFVQNKQSFWYVILIQENKLRTFLLIYSTKHYSFILEESYMDSETFASTRGVL